MTPSAQSYVDQATHNFVVAKHLEAQGADYLDWAVTCLFYSAVHYVNAYLAKQQRRIPEKHYAAQGDPPGRSEIVAQDTVLRGIRQCYRQLEEDSRRARYRLDRPNANVFKNYPLRSYTQLQAFMNTKLSS